MTPKRITRALLICYYFCPSRFTPLPVSPIVTVELFIREQAHGSLSPKVSYRGVLAQIFGGII